MAVGLNVYLVTDGNGREAVEFYKDVFGGEVMMISTFGDSPSDPNHPTPPEAKDRIMHASIKIGDSMLMLSDTFPGMPHTKGDNVTVSVQADSPEEARTIFGKLQEGGNVIMPIQETFWSPAYGMVTDKYGVLFHVNCNTV
ncbi:MULTISPECIES: VOC family protein [Paenibacillus]|uniref:VOC family protein n=1 Tax=Paenibacillus TaxID=44249 RepID=UPI0003FB92F6|nr:VOC family protein [Paenibacillus massiliensis]